MTAYLPGRLLDDDERPEFEPYEPPTSIGQYRVYAAPADANRVLDAGGADQDSWGVYDLHGMRELPGATVPRSFRASSADADTIVALANERDRALDLAAEAIAIWTHGPAGTAAGVNQASIDDWRRRLTDLRQETGR